MEHPETTTQKSIRFLRSIIKREQFVTPISALPYPKEVIGESLFEYTPELVRKEGGAPETKRHLHLLCAALAGCIDDVDVKFVERIEDMLGALDNAKSRVRFSMDEQSKKEFISKGGDESEVAHYLDILHRIEKERERLVAILDPELKK